ncbi:MAG: efflux RND transporter permease subunit [Methylocystis sp.]|nr:efflux RND transporter permease subunit [Methylocystis sp.]MCA6286261.1 efflux RND transporter permease subunit [Phenylobacterium sp.]MCA6289317.1 efflux RND transporter permease subunit [Phenylobacterium sp.]MCA6346643.1 efflux RND transporter permease subunit [Phenylobacterium sp.]MCA6349239.1 efflux RND transporter permease subunit [Phenylobacterium sp.]
MRREGWNAAEAATRAASQRFRPVVLTTAVTVVGLLPLMLQIHPTSRLGQSPSDLWARSGGCRSPASSFGVSLSRPCSPWRSRQRCLRHRKSMQCGCGLRAPASALGARSRARNPG